MFGFQYRVILDMFYVTFQGYRFGSLYGYCLQGSAKPDKVYLKTCYSPDLEKADFDRQSFQYTWWNSYFFSSLRESDKTKNT